MSDNVTANPGSGGSIFATDEIGGVHYTRVKLVLGADNTNDGDTCTGNPLPVTGTVAVTNANLTALGTTITAGVLSVNIAAQAGALTVASHAVTNAGTFATQATQAGTWNITNISGTVSLPTGASTAAKQPALGTAGSASADVITIQGVASMTKLLVTPDANSAVNVAQIGGTNIVTAGVAGTQAVGGNVATNVAIGTNPVNIGAQAVSAENTAVTATRMAQLVTDLVGKLIVLPYANPENFVNGAITSAMTGTTSTSLLATPGSGLRNYITQITVSCAHATQGTDVVIQDGTAGTTLYTIPAAALYGGAAITFPTPLRQPTANTALFAANVTTGSSTKVSVSGYKGA